MSWIEALQDHSHDKAGRKLVANINFLPQLYSYSRFLHTRDDIKHCRDTSAVLVRSIPLSAHLTTVPTYGCCDGISERLVVSLRVIHWGISRRSKPDLLALQAKAQPLSYRPPMIHTFKKRAPTSFKRQLIH